MRKKDEFSIGMGYFIGILAVVFIFILIGGTADLDSFYKIDKTLKHTQELRVAIEKYYQLTGTYPELTKKDANKNLKILDYVDSSGEKISFADIYGKISLEKTSGTREINASNEVYDVKNFENGNKKGGWNYNYSQKTGEIHPNLPEDIFIDKINWNKQ